MPCRIAAVLVVAASLASMTPDGVHAHASLRLSDPLDGATLQDTPSAIRLTFSERPDAALSAIRVVGTGGTAYHIGRPLPAANDSLSLSINVRPLDPGVYTVSWQIVSAVDGHPTTGTFAFGVRADPSGVAAIASSAPVVSLLGIVARWLLLTGLVALLGAAAASLGRFGGGADVAIGAVGCLLAFAGVVLLALAQMRNSAVPLASLLESSVGQSLLWRLVAIAVAGAALGRARREEPNGPRVAMTVVLLAVLMTMALHVAGGHAASGNRWVVATMASQWVHFVAVGIWLGGLPVLLLGLRGAPSASKAHAVRRFSLMAGFALVIVTLTGIARTAGELSAWRDLTATTYGQTVLVKVALTLGIAVCAAVNHWRSVAVAAANLRPLRRTGSGEVMLAAGALVAAATLGSLPPPDAEASNPSGLVVSGVDFGTTLRVSLTMPSDQPGPNRFVVSVADYDSGILMHPRRVSLRFTSLDDPRIAPTAMELKHENGGNFVGSGPNLAFAGRWRITALIEQEGDSLEVPMEIDVSQKAER